MRLFVQHDPSFAEVALSEDDATTTVLPTNGSASHLGDPFHDDASEDSMGCLDERDVHYSDQMDPNRRIAFCIDHELGVYRSIPFSCRFCSLCFFMSVS